MTLLGPGVARFRQLVGDPASTLATARTAGHRCPVKIAGRIQSHSLVWLTAIGAAGEIVEHGMNPSTANRRQLPDRAAAKLPAENRRPIEIAGRVDRHVGVEYSPSPPPAKE